MLYNEENDDADIQKKDLARIQALVLDLKDAGCFHSQISGGIDWGTLLYLPKTVADVSLPTPYLYYSAFYFDFISNLEVIWGEDFRDKLPIGPPPYKLAIPTIEAFIQRLDRIDRSNDSERRAAFLSYKGALLAQIYFGKATIDKREVAELYEKNVPHYPEKGTGRSIIDQYLTRDYPDRPPKFESLDYYREFLAGTLECMRKNRS